MAKGARRDDYSKEAIIYIFPSKGGDYLREVINRGTAIIRGNTVRSLRDLIGSRIMADQ